VKVNELMTRDPATVQPGSTATEAAALMKSKDCGSLPIAEGGKLVGRQAGVAEVVVLLGDAVAQDPGRSGVDRLDDHRYPEVAQCFLVPLEGPAEGPVALRVARKAVTEIVGGQGLVGVEEGGDEVDQPLEPLHAPIVGGRPHRQGRRGMQPRHLLVTS